jgi:hypothetical protein
MTPLRRVFRLGSVEIVLLDDVAMLRSEDTGRIVITGAHGGVPSALHALPVHASLYVFNDAGIGKDGAGLSALRLLNDAGTPALAVRHDSARIGEAEDALANGIIAQCNRAAHALGLRPGQTMIDALAMLAA